MLIQHMLLLLMPCQGLLQCAALAAALQPDQTCQGCSSLDHLLLLLFLLLLLLLLLLRAAAFLFASCSALRWLPRCSLIKHAFEALAINEFEGLEFQLDEKGGGMKTGGASYCCGLEHQLLALIACIDCLH
jgi:hypothetical protein